MEDRGSRRHRVLFFACLALLYAALFAAVCRTPFYDVSGAHNDRLFSADDVYYVTQFFSAEMDDSPRIIKHPLLIVSGCLFTRLEHALFGDIGLRRHCELIVLCQMGLSLASSVFLERILRRHFHLAQRHCLLLCAIYALAFSTLFYTFVPESYILSSLLLILTFWYARQSNLPATVLLGVLTAGTTITNAALWACIVVLTDRMGSWRRRLLVLLLGGVSFCVVTALTPVGRTFFSSLITGALGSARNYRDAFPLPELLRRVCFVFFGSTAFYLDTAPVSAFGEFAGDALSFLPSASLPVTAAMGLWILLLLAALIRGRRDPLLRAPAGVLAANLALHGVLQYGLKEGFLYSLHHLSAQILLAALLLRRERREAPGPLPGLLLTGYLLCELAGNLPGYRQLALFLMR